MSNTEAVIIPFPSERAGCEHDFEGSQRMADEPCISCESATAWVQWITGSVETPSAKVLTFPSK